MVDTVLVDGVDIETNARHLQIDGWGDLFATAGFKGSNYDAPKRDGVIWRQKSLDVGVASLSFSITNDAADADTAIAEANSEWADIVRMFPRRRPVEITRVVTMRDGFGGHQEVRQVAQAELAESIAPNWLTQSFQRAALTFRLLDGCWFSEEPLRYTLTPGQSFYLPAPGTVDTANIVIDLADGEGVQTLTNVSAGLSLTYDWSGKPADSTVQVDVFDFTVTRTDSLGIRTSISPFAHQGDERFMLIDPSFGDNEFTLSSGSAVITYRGAWM